MGVNRLPKSVSRQRRDCDLNPGRSAPESSTLTTRLPSHPSECRNEAVSSSQLLWFKSCLSCGENALYALDVWDEYSRLGQEKREQTVT